MTPIEIAFVIAFSLCFGSFANVCIYRLPVNKSMITPSECMHCNKTIPFYLNIPVIGFFILRGKSACCQKSLSLQYPIVEALTGVGALYLGLIYGINIESVLVFFFYLSLVIIFFTDLNEYIIPNVITYSLSIAGILISYFSYSIFNLSLLESLLGGIISGGILYLTSKIFILIRKKEGMGMGDVKMISMIGFWMGLENTFLVLIASSLLGSIVGIGLILMKKMERSQYIPFGTFLSIGTIMVWLIKIYYLPSIFML